MPLLIVTAASNPTPQAPQPLGADAEADAPRIVISPPLELSVIASQERNPSNVAGCVPEATPDAFE